MELAATGRQIMTNGWLLFKVGYFRSLGPIDCHVLGTKFNGLFEIKSILFGGQTLRIRQLYRSSDPIMMKNHISGKKKKVVNVRARVTLYFFISLYLYYDSFFSTPSSSCRQKVMKTTKNHKKTYEIKKIIFFYVHNNRLFCILLTFMFPQYHENTYN